MAAKVLSFAVVPVRLAEATGAFLAERDLAPTSRRVYGTHPRPAREGSRAGLAAGGARHRHRQRVPARRVPGGLAGDLEPQPCHSQEPIRLFPRAGLAGGRPHRGELAGGHGDVAKLVIGVLSVLIHHVRMLLGGG